MPTAPVPRWIKTALTLNLIFEIAIVVTGGLVRLTGSGLGCPTWPECVPGSFTPVVEQPEGIHKYIEFGNRTLTSVVGIAALAVLVATIIFARRGRPKSLIVWGALPLIGVILQAVVGGITVLTGLHPATVALHFLISMGLIAVSVLVLLRVRQPDQAPALTVRPEIAKLTTGLVLLTGIVLVLGTIVTGSGPHAGDADEPVRFGLDPRAVSWIHSDAVLLWFGLLGAIMVGLHFTAAPARVVRAARLTLAIGLLQGLIGYVQYATKLPEPVVAAHMLGACLLTASVTWLADSQRRTI